MFYVCTQNRPSSSLYLASLKKWETIHIVFGFLFVVALLILNLSSCFFVHLFSRAVSNSRLHLFHSFPLHEVIPQSFQFSSCKEKFSMLANLVYYPLPCLLHVETVSKSLVSSSECIAHRLFSHRCLVMQCSFILPFLCRDVQSLSCAFETSLLLFWVVLGLCSGGFFSLGLRLGICVAWRWCDDWWVGLFVMFVSCLAKPRLLNGFVRSFTELCSSSFM